MPLGVYGLGGWRHTYLHESKSFFLLFTLDKSDFRKPAYLRPACTKKIYCAVDKIHNAYAEIL